MADSENFTMAIGRTVTLGDTFTQVDCREVVLKNLPTVDPVVATTRFIIQSIFTPIVFVFGLVTNLINIVILTRREMRSSTNLYLTSVAVCDIGYLLFAYLNGLRNTVAPLNVSTVYMSLHAYMGPFCSIFSNVSVWIICTFTVERFLVVRWPMKGIMWCTLQNAKRAIGLVACLAVLLTVNEFCIVPRTGTINGTNCTTWLRPKTIPALEKFKNDIHYNWIMPILFQFIPFILLLVLNGFLIRSVIGAQKQRARMTAKKSNFEQSTCIGQGAAPTDGVKQRLTESRRRRSVNEGTSKSESKTTVLLIAVVLLFLICHLPAAFVLLYSDYMKRRYPDVLPHEFNVRRLVIGNASNALVQLNSATNFIVYSFLSRKFVTVFKRLLRQAMPCLFNSLSSTAASDTRTNGADNHDSRVLNSSISGNSAVCRQTTLRNKASQKPPQSAPDASSVSMATKQITDAEDSTTPMIKSSSFSNHNGS